MKILIVTGGSVQESFARNYQKEQGFDYTAVIRQLAKKGFIGKDSKGKLTISTRLCGAQTRCVKLILPEEQAHEENEIDF